jgi:hypothetical protein
MRALLPALLLVLLAPRSPEAAPAAVSAPADDEQYWTVGVASFSGLNLQEDNRYLRHSFPLALRERLTDVRLHFFTPGERDGYRRAVIRRAARRQEAELQKLRRERDALFFQDRDPRELEREQASYDQRLGQAVQELARLTSLDPALVEVPERKEVRFAEGSRGEVLLPEAGRAPRAAAASAKVNLLIYGSLEEIQGYLYLEVHAVDAALEREVYSYADAAGREDLGPDMEAVADGLTKVLWGRDWASLAVTASPAEARIYLDDSLLGTGQARLDFVSPGERALRVELEGYETQRQTVRVEPYSLTELEISLEKLPESLIGVSSDPAGAALYRGSAWLGVTPLEIPRPDTLSRFLLRLEGFRDEPLYLGPSSPVTMSLRLVPIAVDPLARQKRDRNRFYAAFGLFALSLPLPIVSWALVGDYAVAAQSAADRYYLYGDPADLDKAQRLQGVEKGFYYSYFGTLGLSVGLAVNMVVQLVRYVRSADRRG